MEKSIKDNSSASTSASTSSDTLTETKVVSRSMPQQIKNLLAGGMAGMLAKTMVAPIDRIKILYQITATPFYIRDVPIVIQKIIQEEGVAALWKGNMATMIRVFPYAGIQFMVFNWCKSHVVLYNTTNTNNNNSNNAETGTGISNTNRRQTKKEWTLSPLQSLVSGSMAGAVSVLFTYPLDLTRAQLAVLKKQKHIENQRLLTRRTDGFVHVFLNNYTKGGARGLFRGITPTMLGILPYSGIAFAINEQTKRQIYKLKRRDPNTIEKVQCGAISGLIAQSITYPLEVTRRRMQTIGIVATSGKDAAVNVLGSTNMNSSSNISNSSSSSSSSNITNNSSKSQSVGQRQPPTMYNIIKQVMNEQGIRGFFKGLSMNWLKGPVSFSISFTTFDLIKDWIDEEEERYLAKN